MSVTSVVRGFSGTGGGVESPDGREYTQDGAHVYTITTDNPLDDEEVVLNGPGVPRVRGPHPTNPAKRASHVSAEQIAPMYWRLLVEFEANLKPGTDSPLSEPIKRRFYFVETSELVDDDVYGRPIVTPNGERYAPHQIEWQDFGMSVEKNVATFNPAVQWTYANSVNSDTFGPFPPGTARIKTFDADEVIDTEFTYWRISASFIMRRPRNADIPLEKAWQTRIRCEGLYCRFVIPPEPGIHPGFSGIARAADEFGQPTSQPVLLYAEGELAGHRIPIVEPPEIQLAQWQYFEDYIPRPYAPLNVW